MSNILFHAKFKVNRHGILKNSKEIKKNFKTGKSFIGKSDRASDAEKWLLMKLNIEKIKQRVETITCDVKASFIFYYPKTVYFTKKGLRSEKLGDLSNLICLPEDCLQRAGIIANDNLICSLDGSKREPIDSTEYYLEIILEAM